MSLKFSPKSLTSFFDLKKKYFYVLITVIQKLPFSNKESILKYDIPFRAVVFKSYIKCILIDS